MAGGSNGYRGAVVRRQLTPGLSSSFAETAGLPLLICFSTGYPELGLHERVSVKRSATTVEGNR